MIESFTLENFKSFKKATLPLAPLTLLVGPNASGKSNAIEGLQLLSWLAFGHRLDGLPSAAREGEISVRGGLQTLFREKDRVAIQLGLGFKLPTGIEESYGLTIEQELYNNTPNQNRLKGVIITKETLSNQSTVHSFIASSFGQQAWIGLPMPDGPRAAEIFLESTEESTNRQSLAENLKLLGTELRSMLFLNPKHDAMRGYSSASDHAFQSDGSNVSAVLHQLVTNGQRDCILKFVRALPEQDITAIEFIETSVGDVMVQLKESFGGREHLREAAVLSDGTLRMLHIASAVLIAEEGSLVVMEEIDNGVHPSRAKLLLENLDRVARERNIKILLTTHNPALQDALPDHALPDVVACYRDPDTGESKLQRLEDLERYPHLVARGSLGSLSTHGTLEKFLKDRTTPEERREKERAWIESLKARTGT